MKRRGGNVKIEGSERKERGGEIIKKLCYGHFDCAVLVANCTDFILFFWD